MKSVRPFRRVGDVLLYEDEPVFLAGCLPGNPELPEPVESKLELLTKQRNNFFRHWMIPYFFYSTKTNQPDHDGRERNSPFLYDRNLDPPKWRLLQYNAGYFSRLRRTIEAAAARGIVVEISLFDACGLDSAGPDKEKRWPHSPFNAANNMNNVIVEDPVDEFVNGFPEWFKPNATLRSIQAAYVRKVVNEVKGYWNVTFEIMNEPRQGGPPRPPGTPDPTIPDRVAWGDWITGEIVAAYGATPRKQLIFWNSFIGPSGQDLNLWRTQAPNHGNYPQVDGATFHIDPLALKPDSAAYDFRSEKVFQVSTDGGIAHRDEKDWNRLAADHCSALDMVFQAWSIEGFKLDDGTVVTPGTGIGLAVPPPSPLLEPAFLYQWRKVAEAPPSSIPDDLHVRFFADRSFLTFLPGPPYTELEQGYVRDYLGERKVALYSITRRSETIWRYEFLAGGATLRLIRGNEGNELSQDFTREPQAAPEALAPFLYHWRKVPSQSSPDRYDLRFYRDGSYRTFLVNPLRPLPSGEVRALQGASATLTIREFARQIDFTFSFRNEGTMTLLDLKRVHDDYLQTFQRVPRPAGDALLPFLYRWDKPDESTPSPEPRVRLRFFADGSFNRRSLDAPYPELERGEVRAYAPGGTLNLWSHNRGAARIVDLKLSSATAANGQILARTLELTDRSTGVKETFRRA